MARPRRLLPEHLSRFVDLEAGELQVLHNPLGEQLAGIVGRERLPAGVAGSYLPPMATNSDVEYWTARVAELERELDAAPKLSLVNVIAGELMRTRAALKAAKAKSQASANPASQRKRARRTANNAAAPGGS